MKKVIVSIMLIALVTAIPDACRTGKYWGIEEEKACGIFAIAEAISKLAVNP